MEFILRVNMDGAAFADADGRAELARILRSVADGIETDYRCIGESFKVRDANGNTAGFVSYRRPYAYERQGR